MILKRLDMLTSHLLCSFVVLLDLVKALAHSPQKLLIRVLGQAGLEQIEDIAIALTFVSLHICQQKDFEKWLHNLCLISVGLQKLVQLAELDTVSCQLVVPLENELLASERLSLDVSKGASK